MGIRLVGQVAIQECADSLFRHSAHKLVDGLAVAEQLDGRNAPDAEVGCDFLLLLGIQLAKQEFALVFLGEPGQHRHQHLARLAPARPEVQEYRDPERSLHELLEVLPGDVDDEGRLCHVQLPDS